MIHKSIFWLTLLGLAFLTSACSHPEARLLSFAGATMGTTYHIKAYFPEKIAIDTVVLQKEIDASLVEVNAQMSTYLPTSELSRFNQMGVGAMQVSHDTYLVVEEALRIYKMTQGNLDISVGPLVNLWGFGPDQRSSNAPTQAQIQLLRAETGLHQLKIFENTLVKGHKSLYLDLSSLAKGFGVDKIAALLASHGALGYMVEIGGETKTYGTKPNQQNWRIAVEQPVDDRRDIALIIEPGKLAIATSGDYRNFYEDNGTRRSHLMNPVTGYPIQHLLASVTVLHPSCMTADALATAMTVMGTEKALDFASKQGIPVMLIENKQGRFKTYYSEAFKALIDTEV